MKKKVARTISKYVNRNEKSLRDSFIASYEEDYAQGYEENESPDHTWCVTQASNYICWLIAEELDITADTVEQYFDRIAKEYSEYHDFRDAIGGMLAGSWYTVH